MHTRMWACALALAFSSTSHAAPQPPVKVNINGARHDARRDDSASMIVVERADLLRQGDSTLADALRRVPGITIGAGAGGSSELRLRGLGEGYTQVLLNGVKAPDGFALESLAPELIERVEIHRGASAQLSAQAIAGTINIILRKRALAQRQSLKLSLARQRGQLSPGLSGEFAGTLGASAYSVNAALQRTRDFNPSVEQEWRAGSATSSALQRRTVRAHMDTSEVLRLAPRLEGRLANGDTVTLQGLFSAGRRDMAGTDRETTLSGQSSAAPDNATDFESSTLNGRLDLDWTRRWEEGDRFELQAGVDTSHRSSDFRFVALTGAPLNNQVAVRIREGTTYLKGKWSMAPAGQHHVVFGWDAAHAGREQSRGGNDRDNYRIERYDGQIVRAALFIEDDWEITPSWSLSAGLRAEAHDTIVHNARHATVRQRTRMLSPSLQMLLKLAGERQLRLGLARTYKAPTMFDLIPRRYVVDNNNNPSKPDYQGNPALRPELAWGLDASFEQYFGNRSGGKQALVGASAFVRRIDDVSVRTLSEDQHGWVSMRVNQGTAVVHGVALETRLPLKRWTLRADLARNWSRVAAVAGPDNRILEQTPLSANLGAEFRLPGPAELTLGADLNIRRGSRTRWAGAVLHTAGAGERRLDLVGSWRAARQLRLRVGVRNVLGQSNWSSMHYSGAGDDWRTISSSDSAPSWHFTIERVL